MHAAGIRAPPIIIEKLSTAVILSGKQQNGDPTRACSLSCFSKTPDSNMAWALQTAILYIRVIGHVRIAQSQ